MHSALVAEHGGLAGVLDKKKLESTLARPRNLLAYQPDSSLFSLAACYGFGFAKNHCFPDGNKRIALAAIDIFLQINGFELVAGEPEAVDTIRGLDMSESAEKELARWIEANSEELREPL